MRCERCGKQIGNKIFKYNNSYLCPECASATGVADMLANPFAGVMNMMDSDFMGAIPPVFSNLEFSSTRAQIKCPKCGTSFRDFDNTGTFGCIECYVAFNDQLQRYLMKSQPNTDYMGRKPGILSEGNTWQDEATEDVKVSEEVEAPAAINEAEDEKLTKYENSDIGMLSDEDLKEAIQLAVKKENYMLAARFRDELKGREGN